MNLTVLETGSQGNCYILTDKGGDSLILELGVNIKEIQKHFKHDLSNVLGALVTHEHGDHAKHMHKAIYYGIDVYATKGTFEGAKIDFENNVNCHIISYFKKHKIGKFTVMPFDVQHDVKEPCGFVINHPDSGNILFLTDTTYCKYSFTGLNHVLIEANYSEKILEESRDDEFLKRRIIKSHLSLENCIVTLNRMDLTQVNNIILLHLSDRNADAKIFKNEIISNFGKITDVAEQGKEFDLSKDVF